MKLIPGKLYRVIKDFWTMSPEIYLNKGCVEEKNFVKIGSIFMFVEKRLEPYGVGDYLHIFLSGQKRVCPVDPGIDSEPKEYFERVQ